MYSSFLSYILCQDVVLLQIYSFGLFLKKNKISQFVLFALRIVPALV